MSISEKLRTNPELIEANVIVGDELNDLIERKWGSVTVIFTAQNGKITTIKVEPTKIYKISGKEFDTKE